MILLGYQHDRLCPKCHYMMGTTEYHKGHHHPEEGCGAAVDLREWRPKQPHTPARLVTRVDNYMVNPEDYKDDPEYIAHRLAVEAWQVRLWELIREIPEHFDRECPNCKYRWAEAVS